MQLRLQHSATRHDRNATFHMFRQRQATLRELLNAVQSRHVAAEHPVTFVFGLGAVRIIQGNKEVGWWTCSRGLLFFRVEGDRSALFKTSSIEEAVSFTKDVIADLRRS